MPSCVLQIGILRMLAVIGTFRFAPFSENGISEMCGGKIFKIADQPPKKPIKPPAFFFLRQNHTHHNAEPYRLLKWLSLFSHYANSTA